MVDVPISTWILVPIAIAPFIVTFLVTLKFKKRPLIIEMLLLKLNPMSGRSMAYFVRPSGIKQEYIEVDRGDGVLEVYDFEGQASMIIETQKGFDYIYLNPYGTRRILSPAECAGSKLAGDFTDAMDLAIEQMNSIHNATKTRPQAGLLMLVLSLGAGVGLIFLLHLLHLL